MNQKTCLAALLPALLALAACQPQNDTSVAQKPAFAPAAASAPAPAPQAHAAPAASAPALDGFQADARLLLAKLDEIGAKGASRLDTEEMRKKMNEYAQAPRDKKAALAKEISQTELAVYREALSDVKAVQATDKEVAALRDLWARKFETDIKLLEGRIAQIDKGAAEKDWLTNIPDAKLADENEKLAAEAAEKTLEFGRRAR
ncbi:MAG: hypothetical protein Q3966_05195 [Neisseria sp.]|nr:hypothetical protein [Neisseria sp.]